MRASAASPRYRVPASQLAPWLVCSAAFVLIGLSVLSQPLHQVGPGGVVAAALAVAIGCLGAALRLTVDVTLTPAGISYRYNFRRKAIPWASIESFRVASAPGCIIVDVRERSAVRIPIVGSRRYVHRVMGELDVYRMQLQAV